MDMTNFELESLEKSISRDTGIVAVGFVIVLSIWGWNANVQVEKVQEELKLLRQEIHAVDKCGEK
jgi:cytoskeletal protein RodZ